MNNSVSQDLPWVEKYRPKSVQDVVHQEPVKKMLLNVIKTGNMPHCLFFGPPGTGKTSAALALCSELFGEDSFKRRVLELNASDDRGIAVVRDKIKSWTRTMVGSGLSRSKHVPDWKVVILDEADMMTSDAQSALRRIMEDNAKNTRFIIICNYLSRIIDPIASRCAKYRFEPISHDAQVQRLIEIANSEKINTERKAVEAILEISEGDLRIGVTLLQSAATLASAETLTPQLIQGIAGYPPLSVSEQLIKDASSITSGQNLINIQESVVADGWDVNQILRQVLRIIVKSDTFSDVSKSKIIYGIAESQFRLSQGASESLQLLDVISIISHESSELKAK